MYALRTIFGFVLALTIGLTLARTSAAETNAPTPLTITAIQVAAVTPQSATITWQTNLPATDQVSYGLDEPVMWTPVSAAASLAHTVTLTSLTFDTTYRVHLLSADSSGHVAKEQLTLMTPPLDHATALTNAGAIAVNGEPLLPLMVFTVCGDRFQHDLDAGINLFMGDPCGESQFDWLAGRAMTVGDIQHPGYDGKGFIGWFYPDEWDAHLQPPVDASQLGPHLPPSSQSGRITFLDMTSHFYSGAAQWPGWTAQSWQQLESLPDVLGTDLYPLTSWCDPNAFAANDDAQRQLAATGKPSFQWIETRAMDCGANPSISPTADTVRVETWLALIGGAHAIGYFPSDFADSDNAMRAQITAQNRQITALAPALLAPEQTSSISPASSPVKVTVRILNGAVYIVLANSSRDPQSFRITVPGLGTRPITTYDRSRTLFPMLDSFSDTLPGLGTRVYLATPDGS